MKHETGLAFQIETPLDDEVLASYVDILDPAHRNDTILRHFQLIENVNGSPFDQWIMLQNLTAEPELSIRQIMDQTFEFLTEQIGIDGDDIAWFSIKQLDL